MSRPFLRLTLASALALASLPVSAQVINLSTGLNASGVALADGTTDPFWSVSIDGGTTFTAAKVLGDAFNIPCGCGILPNAPTGKWVNRTGVIATGYPIGPAILHRRTFDLTGYDLASVSLAGSWAVMDGLTGMFLNGALVAGTVAPYPPFSGQWSTLHAFSVAGASRFLSGLNTLEFRTTTINGIYDGVLIREGAVRGDFTPPTVVPEPASLALLATGFAGLALVGRRRRAAA